MEAVSQENKDESMSLRVACECTLGSQGDCLRLTTTQRKPAPYFWASTMARQVKCLFYHLTSTYFATIQKGLFYWEKEIVMGKKKLESIPVLPFECILF